MLNTVQKRNSGGFSALYTAEFLEGAKKVGRKLEQNGQRGTGITQVHWRFNCRLDVISMCQVIQGLVYALIDLLPLTSFRE